MRYFQMAGVSPRVLFDAEGRGGGGETADMKTLQTALKDVGGAVKQVSEDLKKHGDTFAAEVKNLGKATKDTTEKVDKALTENTVMQGRLAEIEQAISRIRLGGPSGDRPRSVGAEVVESEDFKALTQKDKKGRVNLVVPIKNMITSVTTDADGSAGDLVRPDRVSGILTPAMRRMTIRALLAPGRTGSNLIEFVKETGFTNNAQPQTNEGDTKGESSLKFDLDSQPVITIAHFVRASKQILDDAAMLQSHIDMRLRFGLALVEENQLLNGAGSGDLDGLINNSTGYSPAFATTDPTIIDTLRLAMLQAALAEWPATGHILNPTDWARIELTKDTQGRYIFANPQGIAGPSLWGLPVVATQAMAVDKFMTGAFIPAAQLFDREDSNVQISTEDADNFTKNLVTIRAEERLSLIVYRPEALIYGDLGNES